MFPVLTNESVSNLTNSNDQLSIRVCYSKWDKKQLFIVGLEKKNEWRKYIQTNFNKTRSYITCLECGKIQHKEKAM